MPLRICFLLSLLLLVTLTVDSALSLRCWVSQNPLQTQTPTTTKTGCSACGFIIATIKSSAANLNIRMWQCLQNSPSDLASSLLTGSTSNSVLTALTGAINSNSTCIETRLDYKTLASDALVATYCTCCSDECNDESFCPTTTISQESSASQFNNKLGSLFPTTVLFILINSNHPC